MANTVAELNALADAAVAAFDAEDYDGALKQLIKAQARMTLMADGEKANLGSLTFDRESLNDFINLVSRHAAAARGATVGLLQFSKLEPRTASGNPYEDWC